MSETTSIPLVMAASGAQPTSPAALNAALISNVAASNPGYTVIPAGLIEDMSSTCTGALVAIDQARVDAVNDITPLGANAFVLAAQGQQAGLAQGAPNNASVYVFFTGTPGYIIQAGFLISDGTNQYSIPSGGVIQAYGQSIPLYAVATNSGTFAIPANSVTQVITSVLSGYTLTVTNPSAGTPAASSESVASYRSRVLQAGIVASTGTPGYLKTLLYAIPGVVPQQVAVVQVSGGWQIICGGGSSYSIGSAILQAVGDISTLQASQLAITGATSANPVVFTTNIDHGLQPGNNFSVSGINPSAFNSGLYTVASVTATTITTTRNGSSYSAYVSGGIIGPNARDIPVTLFQNPDQYTLIYVSPLQQVVTVAATWNTTLPSFTAGVSVNQAASPAIQSYINSIYVTQPINLLELSAVFQEAVASILPSPNLTTLEFAVTINGVTASPTAGTSIIPSDPESYFYCSPTGVTVAQG